MGVRLPKKAEKTPTETGGGSESSTGEEGGGESSSGEGGESAESGGGSESAAEEEANFPKVARKRPKRVVKALRERFREDLTQPEVVGAFSPDGEKGHGSFHRGSGRRRSICSFLVLDLGKRQ